MLNVMCNNLLFCNVVMWMGIRTHRTKVNATHATWEHVSPYVSIWSNYHLSHTLVACLCVHACVIPIKQTRSSESLLAKRIKSMPNNYAKRDVTKHIKDLIIKAHTATVKNTSPLHLALSNKAENTSKHIKDLIIKAHTTTIKNSSPLQMCPNKMIKLLNSRHMHQCSLRSNVLYMRTLFQST